MRRPVSSAPLSHRRRRCQPARDRVTSRCIPTGDGCSRSMSCRRPSPRFRGTRHQAPSRRRAACRQDPPVSRAESTAEIAVHPNGRFVYGSNRGHSGVPAARTLRGGVEDSIAVFSVGADGALTLVEHESTRGEMPRNFALDPTGRWLIAGNQRSNTLAVFSIDQTTGALSPVGSLVSVGSPVSVLFM